MKGSKGVQKRGTGKLYRKPLRNLLWVLFLFFVLWSAVAWGKQVLERDRIETVAVQEGVVEVTAEGTGYVFTEERTLFAPAEGVFRPLVAEGERVPAGMTVAQIAATPDPGRVAAGLDQVQDQLDRLARESDEKTAQLQEQLKAKTDLLAEKVGRMKAALEAGEPLQGLALMGEVEALLQERQALLEELARQRRFTGEVKETWLSQQKDLEDLLRTTIYSVQAPVPGVVSFHLAGTENRYSRNRAMDIKVEELAASTDEPPRILEEGQRVKAGQPLLRLVDNFTLHLAVVLPGEDLEALAGKSRVTIRLPELGDWERACPILRVDGGGEKGLVVVELQDYRPELLIRPATTVQLVLERYRGLVLPRGALVRREEELGLYIIKGKEVTYRPVELIGGNDEVVAVRGIPLYQEVITNPHWVREGQKVR